MLNGWALSSKASSRCLLSNHGVNCTRLLRTVSLRSMGCSGGGLGFGSRRAMVSNWLTRRLVRSTPAIRNASDSRRSCSVPASCRFCACTRSTASGVRISWAASAIKRRSRPSTSWICASMRLSAACIGSSSLGSGASCNGSSEPLWRARRVSAMFANGLRPQPIASQTIAASSRLPTTFGHSV
ncbi:hypothetical protein D3C78_1481370 [compost metagenome]